MELALARFHEVSARSTNTNLFSPPVGPYTVEDLHMRGCFSRVRMGHRLTGPRASNQTRHGEKGLGSN